MRGTVLAIAILAYCCNSFSQDRLKEEAFFQEIEGPWIGSGELVDADGNTIDIEEDWDGSYLDDGSFEMRGTRLWGEDEQEFYWRFTHNESLDLLECEYWHTGLEEPIRFEVSLTETSAEVKAPFGAPGGELIVSNTLSDGKIEGRVSLLQPDGSESLSGSVMHKKESTAD